MKLGKNFDNLGEICGELMISAVSSWYLRWALQFLSYSSNAGLHIHCRDSLKRLNPSQYPHSSHVHCRDSPSLSWYLVQRLTPSLLLPRLRLESPCNSWPGLALIIAGLPRHHRTTGESLLWAVLRYSELYMSFYWTQADVSTWSKGHGHWVPIFGPCQGHFWTMLGSCLL